MISSYLSVADDEFRRKLLSDIRQKTFEHRKSVVSRRVKTGPPVTMKDIAKDTSPGKQLSCLQLRAALLEDPNVLQNYTKADLILIGGTLQCSVNLRMTKSAIINKLNAAILHPDAGPSGASAGPSGTSPGPSGTSTTSE